MIPRGQANALVNRNEDRISREVYDLYLFLKQHPSFSSAPHRFKDVLRASVSGTPFGFIFRGLISVAAARVIDEHIADGLSGDPCATLQRDHFYTWKSNADYFLSQLLLDREPFWKEMKRRNEVVFVTREEHRRLSGLQRVHGDKAYAVADIQLIRITERAMKLAGYKAAFVAAHWPPEAQRVNACLPFANDHGDEDAQPGVAPHAPQAARR